MKLPSTQIDSDGIPFVEWESLLLAQIIFDSTIRW